MGDPQGRSWRDAHWSGWSSLCFDSVYLYKLGHLYYLYHLSPLLQIIFTVIALGFSRLCLGWQQQSCVLKRIYNVYFLYTGLRLTDLIDSRH